MVYQTERGFGDLFVERGACKKDKNPGADHLYKGECGVCRRAAQETSSTRKDVRKGGAGAGRVSVTKSEKEIF